MKKQTRTLVMALTALMALIAVFTTTYLLARKHNSAEGEKALRVDVIVGGETVRTLNFRTDALYLRQALEEQNLIEGEETAFGLMVKTVDGRAADDGLLEWWRFTKGGEMLFTGVDDTPVADGDRFEITLTVGWDDF